MSHQCSASCTAGWAPSRKCHCASCGENFSTVGNFDKHRQGGYCTPPADAGLERNKRGVWQSPGEVDIRERFEAAQT